MTGDEIMTRLTRRSAPDVPMVHHSSLESEDNMNFEFESQRTREKDLQAYKEAFDYYDWNKSGIISVKVNFITGQGFKSSYH